MSEITKKQETLLKNFYSNYELEILNYKRLKKQCYQSFNKSKKIQTEFKTKTNFYKLCKENLPLSKREIFYIVSTIASMYFLNKNISIKLYPKKINNMTKYSQNFEQDYILEYFKGQNGCFLEIGAFSPFTFSNTRALVELGWSGQYVEPSPKCFDEFIKEYSDIGKFDFKEKQVIILSNYAVGSENKTIKFYDSEGDAVSSTSLQHKEKWEAGYSVKFKEIEVQMISMERLLNESIFTFDFLNLDVEGTNIELFNLIPDWFWTDLKMICIEHDSQIDYIIGKLQPFGFKELHRNGENLIMAK